MTFVLPVGTMAAMNAPNGSVQPHEGKVMAFGFSSQATRKYAYGVREFLPQSRDRFDGHDEAVNQLRLANRYQNALVENERARRAAAEAHVQNSAPDLAGLLAAAEAASNERDRLRAELSAANSAAATRNSNPELARRVREQGAIAAAAWRAYRERRRAVYCDPNVRTGLDEIDAEYAGCAQEIRARFGADGLYWGTASVVTQRVPRTGPPPRFHRFDGEGVLAVQFQRKPDLKSPKVPVLDAEGNPRIHPRSGRPMSRHEGGGSLPTARIGEINGLCWIEPQNPKSEEPKPQEESKPSKNKKSRYVWVYFRVRSSETRSPVCAKLPVVMHRPLPEGEVKWAYLVRRRYGTHFRWEVQFDVARPEWEFPHRRSPKGTVAVSLGWRYIDGVVRVASWVGDDGRRGEVIIPADRVRTWRGCEGLQALRDKEFNRCRAILLAFLETLPELPEAWVARGVESLPQWRSCGRFAALVRWWRDNRLPGDEAAFEECEGRLLNNDHYSGGRKQDKHLYDWQEFRRRRCRNWRKQEFRRVALELAKRYKTAVVADINWHEIAENPTPESGEDLVNKSNRGIASCALFRQHLEACMGVVVREPPQFIARDCNRCGWRGPDLGAARWMVCEQCDGGPVDRAENAAQNLLQRYLGVAAGI